jgi:hypothetical protein
MFTASGDTCQNLERFTLHHLRSFVPEKFEGT